MLDRTRLNINKVNGYLDFNALAYACMTNNITNVQMLLNIDGIEINTPDKDGDTPLSHASVFGNPGVVKLLLNKVGKLKAKIYYFLFFF